MKKDVLDFIQQSSFPCIMAKAVAKKGLLEIFETDSITCPRSVTRIQKKLYHFIDTFRRNPQRLSSFFLIVKEDSLEKFHQFEFAFFSFLRLLNKEDKLLYPPDPRVSSEVTDHRFSFSIKSEAFFLIGLHPESPRWSRRFHSPAIVFNPHVQFERMKEKKIFDRIKNIIRAKDKLLQGSINPMLNDFGERSEVFQYLGRSYGDQEKVPLQL